MSNSELGIRFFLQLTVILAACKLVGMGVRKIGQPQVVGEMIAGVLLGPSLFGLIAPDWQKSLFPSGPSMGIIYAVSQVGLVLYMFLVGVDFDTSLIKHRVRSAMSVSLAGIGAPVILGGALALLLVTRPGTFFPAGIATWQAVMFMAAAVAITAFPMLARIIVERKLAGTPLGTLALAAGASDDVVSWVIFAVLLAVIKQNPLIAALAVVGGILYASGMLTVGKRLLARLGTRAEREGGLSSSSMAIVLIALMGCAWLTDAIGIYAIFGGFLLGVAMPRGVVAEQLRTKLHPLTVQLLLPLFFVFSGLNVSIGLLNSWFMWGVLGLVLLASVAGKGVACWGAARLNGVPKREALAIGSLMNARGLMELILLNLGLQAGVITQQLFTILVLMAVVTTLMASPLFELFYGRYRTAEFLPDGPGPRGGPALAGVVAPATTPAGTDDPSPATAAGSQPTNGDNR